MFRGEFKDVVMKLAEDGVWVFLAFIGVQIGIVIASACVRRRQFRKSQAETESECQAIHAFLDALCGNVSNDDADSPPLSLSGLNWKLQKAWKGRPDGKVHSTGDLLKAVLSLTVSGRDQQACELTANYLDGISLRSHEETDLGGMATQGGLLGTVFGAINAFDQLAANTGANPMLKTLGALSFALWTTAVGLVLALALRLAFKWIYRPSRNRLEAFLEDSLQSLTLRVINLQMRTEQRDRKRKPGWKRAASGAARLLPNPGTEARGQYQMTILEESST